MTENRFILYVMIVSTLAGFLCSIVTLLAQSYNMRMLVQALEQMPELVAASFTSPLLRKD